MRFLALFIVTCLTFVKAYKTNILVMTKSTTQQGIHEMLMSPEFYTRYLDQIGAEDIIADPPLSKDKIHEIEFAQKISYRYRPNTPFVPRKYPKILVDHNWSEHDGKFYGFISTKYMSCDVTLSPLTSVLKDNVYGLNVEGKIMYKKYSIIPNKILDSILREFCDIFLKFSNEKSKL